MREKGKGLNRYWNALNLDHVVDIKFTKPLFDCGSVLLQWGTRAPQS